MSLLSPQLQAFLAVAKLETVHGAAAEIHLTQTAVTQRIRSLERLLKTTLFIRTRRGMRLTPEGQALLRYCQASKELEGEALALIQGAGKKAEIELTISAPTSIMHARVVPACVPILKEMPHLLLRFKVDDAENHHLALRAAEADFAVVCEEQLAKEMRYKALVPEEYVLVASAKWKKRRLKDIIQNERIVDFDVSDDVTFSYLKQYGLFDLARHTRYFVNRTDNLALLVAEGIGYTTLAKEFAMPYVKKNQLCILNGGKTYDIRPLLAWFDRPEPPKYFTAIIDAIT